MKPRALVLAILVSAVGCAAPAQTVDAPTPDLPRRPIGTGVAPPDDEPVEPPPVVEQPGPRPERPAIWVSGHWSWSTERNTFLWVRGVWALLESEFEPPPPRAEHPSASPSASMVWAPGAWMYRGKDFLWIGGRWEKARPGFVYVGASWVENGKRWRFVEAGWQKQ